MWSYSVSGVAFEFYFLFSPQCFLDLMIPNRPHNLVVFFNWLYKKKKEKHSKCLLWDKKELTLSHFLRKSNAYRQTWPQTSSLGRQIYHLCDVYRRKRRQHCRLTMYRLYWMYCPKQRRHILYCSHYMLIGLSCLSGCCSNITVQCYRSQFHSFVSWL